MIDLDERRLGYFHNAALLRARRRRLRRPLRRGRHERPDVLPPYVETIRFAGGHDLGAADITEKVLALTHAHVSRAPATNPLARMKKQIQSDLSWLAGSDLATFHRYAFGTCRQCGANAELAAAFVGWLDAHDGGGLSDAIEGLLAVAAGCKALSSGSHASCAAATSTSMHRSRSWRTGGSPRCPSSRSAMDGDLLSSGAWECCSTRPGAAADPVELASRPVEWIRGDRSRHRGRRVARRRGARRRRPATTTTTTGGSAAGSRADPADAAPARPCACSTSKAWRRSATSG